MGELLGQPELLSTSSVNFQAVKRFVMHPVTVLRKISGLPCSSSSLQAVIASLAHLLKICVFMLASWLTACKDPELLAIQVVEYGLDWQRILLLLFY